MAGSCECGKEPSGSIKCGLSEDLPAVQEGLPSMKFFLFDGATVVDQRPKNIEVLLSHSDTPHTAGLLWRGDKPDA